MVDLERDLQAIHSPMGLEEDRVLLRHARSPLHILVVDDDLVTQQLMQSLLGPNYSVALCGDVFKAVAEYLRIMPDLVFLDIDLGDKEFNGFDVAHTICMHDDRANIVFLSAHENIQNIAHARRAGASGFMAKPFKPSRVLHYVQDCERDKFNASR